MADSKSKSPNDTKFKKVVRHFLKTPPKPHKDSDQTGNSRKAKPAKPKRKKER